MLCTGLGNATESAILSTARQGTCMLPILYPLAHYFDSYGLAAVQALADLLSLILAIPICIKITRKIKSAIEESQGNLYKLMFDGLGEEFCFKFYVKIRKNTECLSRFL